MFSLAQSSIASSRSVGSCSSDGPSVLLSKKNKSSSSRAFLRVRGRPQRQKSSSKLANVSATLLDVSDAHHALNHISDIATGVGLPCTVQNCGDMIYRSTLDPELRRELKPLFTTQGAVILSTLLAFFSITPGALPGYVEYY
jgi:hypothetical protein